MRLFLGQESQKINERMNEYINIYLVVSQYPLLVSGRSQSLLIGQIFYFVFGPMRLLRKS